jgi:hypothetical protein
MKTILLLLLLFLWNVASPYTVIIYGVDNCGYTTALRNELTQNNIQFTYCNIQEINCYGEFFSFVKDSKLDTGNYVNLPVVKVVVDNKTYGLVRPSITAIKVLIGITYAKLLYVPSGGLIGIVGAKYIEVYNVSGVRVMYSRKNYINTESLLPGYYILRINNNTVYKFIKN